MCKVVINIGGVDLCSKCKQMMISLTGEGVNAMNETDATLIKVPFDQKQPGVFLQSCDTNATMRRDARAIGFATGPQVVLALQACARMV